MELQFIQHDIADVKVIPSYWQTAKSKAQPASGITFCQESLLHPSLMRKSAKTKRDSRDLPHTRKESGRLFRQMHTSVLDRGNYKALESFQFTQASTKVSICFQKRTSSRRRRSCEDRSKICRDGRATCLMLDTSPEEKRKSGHRKQK